MSIKIGVALLLSFTSLAGCGPSCEQRGGKLRFAFYQKVGSVQVPQYYCVIQKE